MTDPVNDKAAHAKINALEKLLQLELASADLMDECLRDWACNMREMARHNIAVSDLLRKIILWTDLKQIDLPMRDEAIDLLFMDD